MLLETIGAIMTSAKKLGTQYTLEIEDGNSENDKAIVSLFQFKHLEYNRFVFF
jgi:hypothetical protein